MKPQEQSQIEQELGQWENPISYSDHSLELKFEKSDTDIELQLPHPDKQVILVARPGGFQLTSHYNNQIRKDFAIKSADIVNVQLLPSFTIDNHPNISFKYVLFAIVIFGAIGAVSTDRPNIILWILLGLTFGLTASLIFKRVYRQNLIITINDNNRNAFFLFSIDKRQKQSCINFFSNFEKEKFSS